MIRLNKWWVLISLFLVFGILYSFWDYYRYQKIENANYGHGPSQIKPSWNLSELYNNDFAGVRLKYPINWTAQTKINRKSVLGEIAVFSGDGHNVTLTSLKAVGSLKDWEDKTIASLSGSEHLYGERSYLNTDRTSMTVITFQRFVGDQTFMVSRYLAKKNDVLYILEFSTPLSAWPIDQPNFQAMASTLVLF